MSIIRHDLFPNYIEAESPRGLRRKMGLLCLKKNAELQFFDIQTYGEKKTWIAWYYDKQNITEDDSGTDSN